MCGRYTIGDSHNLFRRFRVEEDPITVDARFNVSPSQHMPVIIREEANHLSLMQWGLIPFWSKDPGQSKPMINARVEGLMSKPTFRGPVRKHRCLVPADGFYEWKNKKGGKIPYHIRRKDGALFAFAGIFDVWHGAAGEVLETYAILTTRPNSLMEPIHNRMPVILDERREQEWLETEPSKIEQLVQSLEEPYPADLLESFPVSRQVNSPRLDFPDLIKFTD